MRTPKVTVLMPVYNGEKYLKDAIESILWQDYSDFELLIVNDGSTDQSEKIILSFSDKRIRLVNNGSNIGLVNTLNKGLELAEGEYVARMDCDDISAKNRLSVQVNYMEANTNVAACGSFYYLLLNGKKALADFPIHQDEMNCFLIFNCPIAHPTVILRMSVIRNQKMKYRPEFLHAEDYDFWSRLTEVASIANVKDALLDYRVHPNQITQNERLQSDKNKSLNAIRLRHLNLLGLHPTQEEMEIHHIVSDGRKAIDEKMVVNAETWLLKIIDQNILQKKLNTDYLGKIVMERWLRFCFNYFGGRKGFSYFLNSKLYKEVRLPLKQKMEFFRSIYNSYKRKTIK